MPIIPQGLGKSLGTCPLQGQESSGLEPRRLCVLQAIQVLGKPSSGPYFKQSGPQGTPIFQPGSLRQGSIWGKCLGGEVASGPQVCLPTSKHHPNGPRQASKIGRDPNHDRTLLARSKLVPRDHASGSRATKKVPTITVAPMECHNPGGSSKSHKKHPVDCLEANITICAQSGIR